MPLDAAHLVILLWANTCSCESSCQMLLCLPCHFPKALKVLKPSGVYQV